MIRTDSAFRLHLHLQLQCCFLSPQLLLWQSCLPLWHCPTVIMTLIITSLLEMIKLLNNINKMNKVTNITIPIDQPLQITKSTSVPKKTSQASHGHLLISIQKPYIIDTIEVADFRRRSYSFSAWKKKHRTFPSEVHELIGRSFQISPIWVFPKIGGFSPQIINSNRVFPYKPSILGYHYFWKHPHHLDWSW